MEWFYLDMFNLKIYCNILFRTLTQSHLVLVSNKSTNWFKASNHCHQMGGHLFTLDSYEQWYILMDIVRYTFPANHQAFWMSPLVYLGRNIKVLSLLFYTFCCIYKDMICLYTCYQVHATVPV